MTCNLTSLLIRNSVLKKCLSMLTSLLAAGQDSQLCQIQPPHPTLTQLGSPFSPRSFPTLFPRTTKVKSVTSFVSDSLYQFRSLMVCFGDEGTTKTCKVAPLVAFLDGVFRPGPPPSHNQRSEKRHNATQVFRFTFSK